MRKEAPKILKGAAYTEGSPISDVSHHKAAAIKAFVENHYRGMLRETRNGGSARPVGPRLREPCAEDFILIKRIGKGAFGEVFVCRRKDDDDSGRLYALKRMRKTDMIRKKQIVHVRSEKDVMAEAAASNLWVVRLYQSFQDEQYLYMVMEYMPGGDMISWLCLKQKFDVESTRFYVAELCAAVASVHDMFFVHRDVKPDNILFDAHGHIKLTDFGLSKRFAKAGEELLDFEDSTATDGVTVLGETPRPDAASPAETHGVVHFRDRRMFESIVGSPGYIAPEILLRQRYGVDCDWWSVGVIMYEMLYGIPPFFSHDQNTTCYKITHWREYLVYPTDRGVPDDAVDFMQHLMCDPKERLDFSGIKAHPFFFGMDWDHLREMRAAYIPELSNPLDTQYFPDIEDGAVQQRLDERNAVREVDPRGVIFADYKFDLTR
ncbi:protein kinase [Trypanosoma grayi]|uniref:protein kinase n=1 Tax=Trypanosoma grayi TaxID=71804 RepID=UPI0004F45261|nr:protein kinase [Trypanosoma grayi]KEG13959.1 protein kinase [Trypanosoma grayi]